MGKGKTAIDMDIQQPQHRHSAAKAAQGPLEGPLGHLLPQGPIFSSHNIAAQCDNPIQKLVDGVLKKNTISGKWVRFGYGPNVNSEAKPPR